MEERESEERTYIMAKSWADYYHEVKNSRWFTFENTEYVYSVEALEGIEHVVLFPTRGCRANKVYDQNFYDYCELHRISTMWR